MTQLVRYSDGRQVSLASFKQTHRNVAYAGLIPPAVVLEALGVSLITASDAVPVPTGDDVNTERNRRLALGFMWSGHLFQADPESMGNINGAATSALAATTLGGIDPSDTFWTGGGAPFGWLSADNVYVVMAPQDVVGFGNAALAHKSAHIFAARALKGGEIPADFRDDKYWP